MNLNTGSEGVQESHGPFTSMPTYTDIHLVRICLNITVVEEEA